MEEDHGRTRITCGAERRAKWRQSCPDHRLLQHIGVSNFASAVGLNGVRRAVGGIIIQGQYSHAARHRKTAGSTQAQPILFELQKQELLERRIALRLIGFEFRQRRNELEVRRSILGRGNCRKPSTNGSGSAENAKQADSSTAASAKQTCMSFHRISWPGWISDGPIDRNARHPSHPRQTGERRCGAVPDE